MSTRLQERRMNASLFLFIVEMQKNEKFRLLWNSEP